MRAGKKAKLPTLTAIASRILIKSCSSANGTALALLGYRMAALRDNP